ncbi:Zn(2)-C6 fungal-type DNA-binding domain protein [Beauveria brongniartii RCEF 3172]|uniref:Zn(2)-C6 fungal-type DNA-binding domain protein n=1 Tax=Beauveria brongniartii RCEF 3172 TaxID=1081107 RepID=A0A167HQD2_9HYPO|nr:Zn(2)-C6 fungal-type DNA-binding domain protein [Beauveria brongniartii RCEF 3172]
MGAPGKRMRLGTKSCAECRRRKVRCIFPQEQERCDACRAHGSSCVPQEKQSSGDGTAASGAEDVAALKRRLDELEALMRGLPGDMVSRRSGSTHGAEGGGLSHGSSSMSPSLSDDRSPASVGSMLQPPSYPLCPSLISTAQMSPALQNSPLINLFRATSIFDPIPCADADAHPAPLLTPTASSRLRQCLTQFAPYLPRPDRVAELFTATQRYWGTWPPYFAGAPSDSGQDDDRLLEPVQQVPVAETKFHSALVSGRPCPTAKAILFLALCVQQTPKRAARRLLLPASVTQQALVDTYVETARALLRLDAEEASNGGTLDGVEALNMMYKLCINAGRPQRAWTCNREAIAAAICAGLPVRAARTSWNRRAAQAWAMAWRAERYMAMTLGLPSCTSALHPGLVLSPDESVVSTILYHLAVLCGKIIDRDQSGGDGDDDDGYATTLRLDAELVNAQRRLFPAHWWAADHLAPDLDQAAGWHRQSCKVLFFTALQLVHLPYLARAAADARYLPSRHAAMSAARGVCAAYCEFRRWSKGGAELCQMMDFRAFSAALVLTAAVMECTVAEQAVRTLDALDAARRGVYMADEDYDVVVPYFGRIRINRAFFEPKQQESEEEVAAAAAAAASAWFNTVEFSTNDFLVDFHLDAGDAAAAAATMTTSELCCDWGELGLGYASMDWGHSFTCGPFVDVEGAAIT